MWLEIIGEIQIIMKKSSMGVPCCFTVGANIGMKVSNRLHITTFVIMCAISVFFSLGISAIMGLNRNQALFPRSALAGAFNFVTFMCGLVPICSSGAMPARSLLSASKLPVVMSEQLWWRRRKSTSTWYANTVVPRPGWITCLKMPPSLGDRTTSMSSSRLTLMPVMRPSSSVRGTLPMPRTSNGFGGHSCISMDPWSGGCLGYWLKYFWYSVGNLSGGFWGWNKAWISYIWYFFLK